LWTPDRRPGRAVRVHLEEMCRRCPVRRRCAADAVSTAAECGMYAGVWVPQLHQLDAWVAAMAKLRVIAGMPGAAAAAALGVSA